MDIFSPSFGVFFWQLVSFLLLLFLAKKFFLKKIINTIQQREEYINRNIKEAREAQSLKAKLDEEIKQTTMNLNKQENDFKEKISLLSKKMEKELAENIDKKRQEGMKQVNDKISQYEQECILSSKNEIANTIIDLLENLSKNKNMFTEENKSMITSQMIEELVNKKYTYDNNPNNN